MKPKAAYFSGKIGDALLQWPVAEQWLRDHGEQAEVWLDPTCKPLVDLFRREPTVSDVKIVDPAENYSCGGQPWQGKFSTELHNQYEIVCMGFRAFPQRQITMQTAMDCSLKVKPARLATEPAFGIHVPKQNRVALHGTFTSHVSGTPGFWRVLWDIRRDLEENFDEIVFTGTAQERERARELYPNAHCSRPDAWRDFDDHGSFLELAELLAGSRLVIAAGSSCAALGSVLKVPTLRVHDDIHGVPKHIWSGLGDNQWNETPAGVRKAWPVISESLRSASVVLP